MPVYPIREVYTTAGPPRLADMFVGRGKEFADASDIIQNTDKHLLITGQRGIGKTSFCAEISKEIPGTMGPNCRVHRLVAHTEATPQSFFSDFLSKIGINSSLFEEKVTMKGEGGLEIGFPSVKLTAGGGGTRDRTSRFLEVDHLSPNQLLAAVAHIGGLHMVIIDEFDLLARARDSGEIASRLMQLAKAASDSRALNSGLRFVFAGLTYRASELLSRHESIGRYVAEIRLRRISRPECHKFFDNGERLSGISFHPVVRDAIVNDSNGYPYFLQEVANHCCRAAARSGSEEVELSHYTEGLEGARQAVERAQNVRFYANYARLPPVARSVLDYVAMSKAVEVQIPKLLTHVVTSSEGWTSKMVHDALELLVRSDIFLYRAADRGVVGFIEPFFQGYLERRLKGPVHSKLTSRPNRQLKMDLDVDLARDADREPR